VFRSPDFYIYFSMEMLHFVAFLYMWNKIFHKARFVHRCKYREYVKIFPTPTGTFTDIPSSYAPIQKCCGMLRLIVELRVLRNHSDTFSDVRAKCPRSVEELVQPRVGSYWIPRVSDYYPGYTSFSAEFCCSSRFRSSTP